MSFNREFERCKDLSVKTRARRVRKRKSLDPSRCLLPTWETLALTSLYISLFRDLQRNYQRIEILSVNINISNLECCQTYRHRCRSDNDESFRTYKPPLRRAAATNSSSFHCSLFMTNVVEASSPTCRCVTWSLNVTTTPCKVKIVIRSGVCKRTVFWLAKSTRDFEMDRREAILTGEVTWTFYLSGLRSISSLWLRPAVWNVWFIAPQQWPRRIWSKEWTKEVGKRCSF